MTAMTAVTTRTAGTAGTAGTEGRHRRTTGPTGTHARGKWSTRKNRPLSRRRAFRTFGTERAKHAVVMVMMVVDRDGGAGEEDHRHHEDDAGNDHHPCRNLVKPRGPCSIQALRRRKRARGGRRDLGFRCLGHVSIMPTLAPVIKHCVQQVANDLPSQREMSAGSAPTYQQKAQTNRRITTAIRVTPAMIATHAAT
jgi:hypothetical protein